MELPSLWQQLPLLAFIWKLKSSKEKIKSKSNFTPLCLFEECLTIVPYTNQSVVLVTGAQTMLLLAYMPESLNRAPHFHFFRERNENTQVQVDKLLVYCLLCVVMVFRSCFTSGNSCREHGEFWVVVGWCSEISQK